MVKSIYIIHRNRDLLFLILLSFFVFPNNIYSQDKASQKSTTFYPRNIVRLEMAGAFMNRMKIEHFAVPTLQSNPSISPIVGLAYYRKLYKSFGLGFSFGGLVIPINQNYKFDIAQNDRMDGAYDLIDYDYHLVNFTTSLVLEKYVFLNKHINLFAGIGAQYNYIYSWKSTLTGYRSFDELQQSFLFFHSYIGKSGDYEFLSYLLKIGTSFKFGKHHLLQSSILANIYNKPIGTGYYEFGNLPFESYGTLELKMNYIGLQLSYGFGF